MTRTRTLVWKETREHLPFLLAGWGLFLGVTLLAAASAYFTASGGGKFYSDMGIGMVVLFGPLLAIFLASGASCRDLTDQVCEFWQSRPVSPRRLLLTKYAAGVTTLLLIVFGTFLLVFTMALGADLRPLRNASRGIDPLLAYYPLALVLVYSVSFLLGSLVRRTAQAAMLSKVAVLVLYLLPLVFPPLDRVGIINLLMRSDWLRLSIAREAPFTAFALAGCAASVVLSVKAVKHGWRLHVGKRFICWTLVAAGLILWCATTFPLANNLECLQQYPIVPDHRAWMKIASDMAMSGARGVLVFRTKRGNPGEEGPIREDAVCEINVTGDQVATGPEIAIGDVGSARNAPARVAWLPERPERAYVIQEERVHADGESQLKSMSLYTVAFDAPGGGAVINNLDLTEHVGEYSRGDILIHPRNGNIYVRVGRRIIVVDVKDPDTPKVTRVFKGGESFFEMEERQLAAQARRSTPIRPIETIPILALEEIPLRERLDVSLHLGFLGLWVALEDDIVVAATKDHLTTYRVTNYDQETAQLEKLGERRAAPLERIYTSHVMRILYHDGLVYALTWAGTGRGLTVYDVRNPSRPRRIRHYAAPDEDIHDLAILPDGKVLLVGRNLHIVEAAWGAGGER